MDSLHQNPTVAYVLIRFVSASHIPVAPLYCDGDRHILCLRWPGGGVLYSEFHSANAVPSIYCGHYCNTLATRVATIIAIYRDNINSRYDTKQGSSCRDTGLISADWCS